MKRIIALIVLIFSLYLGQEMQAQTNEECFNMFEIAMQNYEKGEYGHAERQFKMLLTICESDYIQQKSKQCLEEIEKKLSIKVVEAQNGLEITVKGVSFTMVAVKGGTFTMGATAEQGSDAFDWEKPTHQVTLSDYYIGETEVTQELWEAVMGNNPSKFKGDRNLPVEMVSWQDCQLFIERLNQLTGKNFRLPTEAEWEYAARGGNKSQGYKYSGSTYADDVAWYDGNSGSRTHIVKGKRPNELGLYDMSGNVREWCSDWYGDYSSSAQTNPRGATSGSNRVLRGGSWCYNSRYVRVSNRYSNSPDYRSSYGGLRLAL